MSEFLSTLEKLSSAEDFLNFLEVPYDADVVKVNRLHILKRFNEYIAKAGLPGDLSGTDLVTAYQGALTQAYQDLTVSSGVSEKMFKVFKQAEKAKKASFVGIEKVAGK